MTHPRTAPRRAGAEERVARAVMLRVPGEGQPDAAEIRIARENSVGLELSAHYPQAQSLAQEEAAKLDAFWTAAHDISALLAARSIPHIYIKLRKLYRYYDSDVDVIVAREHWPAAIAALEGQGYTGHVMFKEPDKIMFTRAGDAVSVHLHSGVTWNGVPYFSDQELWRHSVPSQDGAWRELNREHDFLTNLAHDVFENYEISLGDMLYFRRFQREQALNEGRLERVAAQNGWRGGFRRSHAFVQSLVEAWNHAAASGEITHRLRAYPYRISRTTLAAAFAERIGRNIASGQLRSALREAYAYPIFWALKRRHDLPFLPMLAAGLT